MSFNSIRIYHEYEGRIEKSVQRIAVWHHEGFPREGFFFFTHTNNEFFFLLTTVLFILKKASRGP